MGLAWQIKEIIVKGNGAGKRRSCLVVHLNASLLFCFWFIHGQTCFDQLADDPALKWPEMILYAVWSRF